MLTDTDPDTSLTDTNNPKNTDSCFNRYRYMVFLGIGKKLVVIKFNTDILTDTDYLF